MSPAEHEKRRLVEWLRAELARGGLLVVVELAKRALQLAEALEVERVEVDAVAAAGGPP